ncbi:MarR family winged helix-turn-helix transcriptional regulator [Chloroflexota bacterium]
MKKQSPESRDRAIAAIMRFIPFLRRMHREIYAYARKEHKLDNALAIHHFLILKTLQEFGTLSSSELGAMIFVSRAQMTHSAKKLIDIGLVTKKRDVVDHRKVNIQLTPKGKRTIQWVDKIIIDHALDYISSLAEGDLEKLVESFDYIDQVFSSSNRAPQ